MIEWLFPRRCPVCGEIITPVGSLICRDCVKKLSPVRQPSCKKCGKELLHERMELCADCIRHPHTFDSGAALLNYNDAAKESMAAVKYKNKREYLDFYAEAMARRFERQIRDWKPEVLIPIPIHPSRRRKRGFNQAEELARRLGKHWKIPVETRLLRRNKRTMPQKMLNSEERLKNLEQAFVLGDQAAIKHPIPQRVVLIDDIYTTGSTMEACARVLRAAGVEKIYFLTICIGNGK